MKPPRTPLAPLAPMALAAALAGHGAAEARTEDPARLKLVGPEPVSGLSAEEARARGKALLQQNNPTDALQAFRQALAQDPDSVEALNGMAVAFDRLGRFEDARLHYEAALGIDPGSPHLLNNYGLSLHLQGADAEAARFLRLAAAAGDPQVQAASLRILARIEARTTRAPQALPARAAEPPAASAPTVAVVRTSGHEQRLVLSQPRKPAPGLPAATMLASGLPADQALAIAAVGGLSEADEARIAAREAAAVAAEQAVAARLAAAAEAQALRARARAMVPAEMQVAALLEAARAQAAERTTEQAQADASPWAAPAEAIAREPQHRDWYQDQLLVLAPAPGAPARRKSEQAAMRTALLAAGFAPPRPDRRAALAEAARAALAAEAPRRAFDSPFESDNARLNDLAERLHARPEDDRPSVAEQVARLEALIARVQAA